MLMQMLVDGYASLIFAAFFFRYVAIVSRCLLSFRATLR